jgi:hypothetical protein
MNLRETIRKQQENWITKLDGKRHPEIECQFCVYMEAIEPDWDCDGCPVMELLGDCIDIESLNEWWEADSKEELADAARLVLADVNKIAKHYHYAVREE